MRNETNWLSSRVWVGSALFWLLFAIARWAAMLWEPHVEGRPTVGWPTKLLLLLLTVGPYCLATPLLLAWTGRLTRSNTTPRRFWTWLLAALAACLTAQVLVTAMFTATPLGDLRDWALLLGMALQLAVYYAAILGFSLAVNQKRIADARERDLLAAQLGALRAQLQPHFLFNTLHAISVTGRSDAAAASRMLALLGDLLRLTLRKREGEFVSLAAEHELLQPYIELQQLRFGERLRIEIDFPPDLLGAVVPDLLLQPLVENALKHGIERRPEGGRVRIAARRWHDQLEIQVADDGAGIEARPYEVQLGVGLGATKARLQGLFGDGASLELAAGAAGGATVTLRLPWREMAHAA